MNNFSYKNNAGRVALITGAGTGIGGAVARRLSRDGFIVGVGYSQSSAGAEAAVFTIKESGGEAFAFRIDITHEEEVINFFDYAIKKYGRVDVVINNAGIGHMKPFSEITFDEYKMIFDVNSWGTFVMCREAARKIKDFGRILNISSGATLSNSSGMSLYIGSKLST
ncbi:MAG: SDR family NAD(P)-dependent oxidoreductase [Pseudomonadales bacterium]|jgi:3-oxoacyl-[acyl-carrier protein] reductase|nr:SDR family NAD(P)-dependent oxidoreductase [Pseudomonadales bacterium]